MKKFIVLIAACVFSWGAMAQDNPNTKTPTPNQSTVKYCAKMISGKIIVQQDQKDLIADANLVNGTTIKTDGTIIKSDGTQSMLKNGECVDNNGNLINPKMKEDKMPPK
jgi:hypothetical protein